MRPSEQNVTSLGYSLDGSSAKESSRRPSFGMKSWEASLGRWHHYFSWTPGSLVLLVNVRWPGAKARSESRPPIAFTGAPLGSMAAAIWGYFGILAWSLCILGLEDSRRVQWCAVGQQERAKCDHWSAVSGGALACVTKETPEDCIAAITVGNPLPHPGPWFWVNLLGLTHEIQILLGLSFPKSVSCKDYRLNTPEYCLAYSNLLLSINAFII